MTRYRTIVADPPWKVQTGRIKGAERGFVNMPSNAPSRPLSYPTMTVDEIAALPVREIADTAAHLYLWTINKYVEDAYRVARAWGFKPSTLLVWAKPPMGGGGLGGTFKIRTEYLLFARRGTLGSTDWEGSNWWEVPRVNEGGRFIHSAKPDFFLDLIERVSPGPYLEMFARRARFGWDYWGDESLGTAEMAA